MTYPSALIERITIVAGTRLATVHVDGRKRVHGLGSVGEPLGVYLGDRASDHYSLALPADRRDLPIFEALTKVQPNASGHFPRVRTDWTALEAADYPTAVCGPIDAESGK